MYSGLHIVRFIVDRYLPRGYGRYLYYFCVVGRSRGVVAVVSPSSGSGSGPCVAVKYPLRALLMTLAPRSQRGSTLKRLYRTMLIRFLKTQGVKKKVNDMTWRVNAKRTCNFRNAM